MSGEVVAAPAGGGAALVGIIAVPIVLPLLAVGAAGAVAYGAGKIIKGIVDARVEAAVREMEAEMGRINEWRDFQIQQRQQQVMMQQQYEALRVIELRLASITLAEPVAASTGNSSVGQGYVSVKKVAEAPPIEAMREMLQMIAAALYDSPDSFQTASDSPYPRLKQSLERISGKLDSRMPPLPDEIVSFRNMVTSTINHFMDDSRCIRERSAECVERVDKLLSDIVTTHALADESTVRNSLQKLKIQALALLEKNPIPPGQVEFVEQRVADIKVAVDARLVNGAFRATLAEALTRNLVEMGYGVAQSFPEDSSQTMMRAELKIPGGERLRMTIDRTNRMSFQVFHEAHASNAKLTADDKRHFRAQEKLWCQDLKGLIRKLTQEGFAYTIGHENLIPDMRIPVAVVEDVDEIVSRQNEAEVEMIRRRMHEDQARARRMP